MKAIFKPTREYIDIDHVAYSNNSVKFVTTTGDFVDPIKIQRIHNIASVKGEGKVMKFVLLHSGHFLCTDNGHIYYYEDLSFVKNKEDEKDEKVIKENLNPLVYIRGVKGRGKEILELLEKHGGHVVDELTFENPDFHYYIMPSCGDICCVSKDEQNPYRLVMNFYKEITLPEIPAKKHLFEVQEGQTDCFQCPLKAICPLSSLEKIVKCNFYDLTTLKEITGENI